MADSPQPPPPPWPWKKGSHDTHDVLVVELEICRDEFGRVYSLHKLQDDTDKQVAMAWPTGGQEQLAYALLLEAARREAILDLLVKMTQEPGLLERLKGMSDEERSATTDELAKLLSVQMQRTVARVSKSVVEEAIQSLLSP